MDYVKTIELLVTNVETAEEAEAAFQRSGIALGHLIGEAQILDAEPATELA